MSHRQKTPAEEKRDESVRILEKLVADLDSAESPTEFSLCLARIEDNVRLARTRNNGVFLTRKIPALRSQDASKTKIDTV